MFYTLRRPSSKLRCLLLLKPLIFWMIKNKSKGLTIIKRLLEKVSGTRKLLITLKEEEES